jgi:SAM-dependent methyltransferase
MTEHSAYFEYLRSRSVTGQWYRQAWLYPRLCRELNGKVLDVGCGIGDMLRARPGTVGVDINPQTVAWCRSQGLDVHVMEPDRLPFADAQFDAVVLDNVLEHIEVPQPLLGDIHRVLRPKGRFIVGVPGVRGYASDPDHKVYYDEDSLRHTVEATGFRMQRLIRMPLPIAALSRWMPQYTVYGVFDR